MKEIKLPQDKICLVDDEDFELLSNKKWHILKGKNTVYVQTHSKINGKDTKDYMHRIIMKLDKYDKRQVDHTDGNGLNNQKSNLRICTSSQNTGNSKKQSNNTSGYKGVFYHKHSKKYQVQIMKNGKLTACGYFKTKEEAALAYDKKAKELFGEFAKLNFTDG